MIADNYSEKWQVFTVAEASSVLYKGGVQRQALDPDQIIKWQEGMLNTIFQFEKVYENIAAIEKKRDTIIICDRGGMDPKVFTQKPEEWPQLLEKLGITEQDILDRYEAVIQLFTAPE
uniref:NadR/Ttd14 AAA domain-containing protein n=1 Tax=Panagrolaimus sp. JU765 TaxID=591449 RepID=A0AC34QLZ4_9BILA